MSDPSDPSWATNANYSSGPYAGQANKQTPPSGNIQEGFVPGQVVPAEWVNDRLNNHGQWINLFKGFPRIVGAAYVNGGTALTNSYGLDGTTPYTHNSTGAFTLKLSATIADPTKVLVFVAPLTIAGFGHGVTVDGLNVVCSTANSSAAAVDTTSAVIVFQIL